MDADLEAIAQYLRRLALQAGIAGDRHMDERPVTGKEDAQYCYGQQAAFLEAETLIVQLQRVDVRRHPSVRD